MRASTPPFGSASAAAALAASSSAVRPAPALKPSAKPEPEPATSMRSMRVIKEENHIARSTKAERGTDDQGSNIA